MPNNKIDTLKILIPIHCVSRINWNYFADKQNVRQGNLVTDALELRKEVKDIVHGLSILEYDKRKVQFLLEFSAKILDKNYLTGITNVTIYDVIDMINRIGCIYINPEKIIDYSTVCRVDFCKDIRTDNPVSEYINLFRFTPSTKYTTRQYRDETIVFENQCKTSQYKIWVKMYDKDKQMISQDKYMYERLPAGTFDRILRIEDKLDSYRQIRAGCGISENTLTKVLNTTENVVYATFDKMIRQTDSTALKIVYQQLKNRERIMSNIKLEKYLGIRDVIQYHNNNFDQVKAYLKLTETNPARAIQRYKEVYDEMIKTDIEDNFKDVPHIQEIRSKIAV